MAWIAARLGALLVLSSYGDALSSTHGDGCRLRRAPAEAGEIAFRDCGRGEPVLIIPGGPGLDAEYMAPLARMVTQMGKRTILVEPRGTGASRSARGDGRALTVAGSVADIEAVRRETGAERLVILGHSFGGAVAQAYAAAHPSNVAALILMDSVGPSMTPPAARLDSWRDRATPDELAGYDAARARGDRLTAMRMKFRISFYHRGRGEAFVAGLPDSSIHLDVGPLAASYDTDFHINAKQPRPFPVTLLAGDIDWIRGYESALQLAYPGARTILIAHAGHFPWADSPATFRRVLRRVLTAR